MPKILWKDLFVEIRHSLGRFFSILCIVALGVAFFAGIKASAPDMKYSADQYFDHYNTQDIQVFSTLGLRQSDIDAIKKLKNVEKVQPLFTMDALTRIGTNELVYKIFSLPQNSSINQVRLVEGRMPEKDDECLIEAPSISNELFESYKIGETVHLYSGDSTPITDTLKYDSYKIVGTCYTTRYLSYEKGTSSIGSGEVNSFLFIPESDIKADYYTEIDVTVKDAKGINTYAEEYFDVITPVVKEIEGIADQQIQEEIDKQNQKVQEARDELNEKITEGQKQIDEAKATLAASQKQVSDSEAQLNSAQGQLDQGWNEYYANLNQLDTNLPQVEQGIAQIEEQEAKLPELEIQKANLEAQKTELENKKSELSTQIASLQQAIHAKSQLENQLSALQAQLESLEAGKDQMDEEQYQAQKAQLESTQTALQASLDQIPANADSLLNEAQNGVVQVDSALQQINSGIAQIDNGIAQIQGLSSTKNQLIASRNQIYQAYPQLDSAYQRLIASQSEYESGLAQLEEAKAKIASGQKEIEDKQKELDDQKAEALKEIEEAQKEIDDLEGKWVVLDRNSFYSYRDYEACADRMDGIASVFPVFFFLVAALVCMTTMTRMVDEQRTEIGTLKALGYSKFQIAMKYMMYALIASLLGSIIGCSIGMFIFPYIIFYAWNTMYLIETIQYAFQPSLMIFASASVTGVVLLATFLSIYKELMEVPSQLMRPKAGKAGKKILLEHIPALWNKVSFLHKVTIRNIFRYKKRFLMTVIGIAGCSALLVAGFGINDSISDIVNQQYQKIYHIDAAATMKGTKDTHSILEKIKKIPNVRGVFEEQTLNVTVDVDDKEMSGTVHIIPNDEIKELKAFTTLYSVNGSDVLSIPDKGVLISQKLAEKKGLRVGDSISFIDLDDQKIETTVSGVFENYVGHQIYVSESVYKTWKVSSSLNTTFLLQIKNKNEKAESELGNKLLELGEVQSVQFYSSLQENFINMISSIQMIVVVLVISAAALAFVVLYNLSNVNISERMREIATIKVLGFTESEVNAYVNRESLILAVIGSLLGLVMGIGLHHLIMNLAELDDIMFGRTILPQSFLFAFVLTIVFALLVNFVMKFKLRKVKMVESLKAVE